jgi:hypothetical protein
VLSPEASAVVNLTGKPLIGIGIGLGILTDIPIVTLYADCDEGFDAEEIVNAKIFFNIVNLII